MRYLQTQTRRTLLVAERLMHNRLNRPYNAFIYELGAERRFYAFENRFYNQIRYDRSSI